MAYYHISHCFALGSRKKYLGDSAWDGFPSNAYSSKADGYVSVLGIDLICENPDDTFAEYVAGLTFTPKIYFLDDDYTADEYGVPNEANSFYKVVFGTTYRTTSETYSLMDTSYRTEEGTTYSSGIAVRLLYPVLVDYEAQDEAVLGAYVASGALTEEGSSPYEGLLRWLGHEDYATASPIVSGHVFVDLGLPSNSTASLTLKNMYLGTVPAEGVL